MSSMFLRKTITTLIGLGALFGASVGDAGAISTVEVRCTAPECYEQKPIDPPDEPPGYGPNPGGGGGGPEPECPQPPGGKSLLPSMASLECPDPVDACLVHEQSRPIGCDSRSGRPSGWDEGRDRMRGGSPIARMAALADPSTPTGSRLSSNARARLQAGLAQFNEAGGFADLSEIRRSLSNAISEACSLQRGVASPAFNQGWTDCANVAVEIHREAIDDPGLLAFTLGLLERDGVVIAPVSWSIISWTGGGNSLSAHFAALQTMNRCASWWEQKDQLGCGK